MGPKVEIIEAHRILDLRSDPLLIRPLRNEPYPETAEVVPALDLERMWHRGRFAPSLFAVSGARSSEWLARHGRSALPTIRRSTPRLAAAGGLWPWLALQNGVEERGIQRRSGISETEFREVNSSALQNDILFRLPLWSPPDEPAPGTLLYWTDPGLLHHYLGLDEALLLNWNGRQTAIERERRQLMRAKSWEGFVISSLLRAAGDRVEGRVWLAEDGEIDLILCWREAKTSWAVEVTIGRNKKLGAAFARGCGVTQATRAIAVFNDRVGKSNAAWEGGVPPAVEWLPLEDAIRIVRQGP